MCRRIILLTPCLLIHTMIGMFLIDVDKRVRYSSRNSPLIGKDYDYDDDDVDSNDDGCDDDKPWWWL